MSEKSLVESLVRIARRELKGFVVFKHADRFTHGVPDISSTGSGKTTWWEVKHADPTFDSPGIQELTMKRLDAAGYARYIIFRQQPKMTFIVRPVDLANWDLDKNILSFVGFDLNAVVETMWKAHLQ